MAGRSEGLCIVRGGWLLQLLPPVLPLLTFMFVSTLSVLRSCCEGDAKPAQKLSASHRRVNQTDARDDALEY